jgi:hypothetical protein
MPAQVAKLFKARSGYANYYFNELNRDRVWTAFSAKSNFADAAGPWKLKGQLEAEGEFSLTLDQAGVRGAWPAVEAAFDAARDFDAQLVPNNSGGLFVALHVWRRMLVQGPTRFGDTYYHGKAPLADRDGLFDVLVGTHNVVETRFIFSPDTGDLAALEMFSDPAGDPCELYFHNYRETNGRRLPERIEVRHAGETFATLVLAETELGLSLTEEAAP